jgi:hypothetical protein
MRPEELVALLTSREQTWEVIQAISDGGRNQEPLISDEEMMRVRPRHKIGKRISEDK